jgi:septum formation protein
MLVLASASPQRRELLTQAGVRFRVHPAHIAEDPLPGEEPVAYVTRLAREKAEVVYRELAGAASLGGKTAGSGLGENEDRDGDHEDRGGGESSDAARGRGGDVNDNGGALAVLGADTTVTVDGAILGKPVDAADAARMLRLLSGRSHRVITGVALATADGTEVAAEVTAVKFLSLSDEEIAAYVATGEPMDKAGAYAVQSGAARWIPRIEGCYFNVVGLPLALVCALIEGCAGTRGGAK